MSPPLTFHLADEAATDRLAGIMAPLLGPGDVILLGGPIGAGKTHFCRALIRARLGRLEDVPSPTFTLVQTYEADVEIWHADLYRLSHPDEVAELGLEEAFATAICLVEWPDRLGRHLPEPAIRLRLSMEGSGRKAEISGARPEVALALKAAWKGHRLAAAEAFLRKANWGDATRRALAGDASTRSYQRLTLGGASAILMDAPQGQADSVAGFVKVAGLLRSLGLSAPEIFAADMDRGFLLLEDFGDGVFARLIHEDPQLEEPLYQAATDVLVHLQAHPPASGLADLSAADWADATRLAVDWYRFAITGEKADAGEFATILCETLQQWADGPRVMILRDYHAENLMLLPNRQGLSRIGLLDFQLAQMGQPGYDLVSLLQDARRDVSQGIETAMIRRFLRGAPETDFLPAYAALGAQRALRILGVFARLCLVEGKPHYVSMMPRVWAQLQRNLARPELTGLARVCADLIPEPTTAACKRIEAQCGSFR